MFDWKEEYHSICNAPVELIDVSSLDSDHPAIQFNKYWRSLAVSQTPDRKAFKPQDVAALLRWVMMFRQVKETAGKAYFLYLQGDSASELTGGLLQGQFLQDFTSDECFASRFAIFEKVLSEGVPSFATISVGAKKSEFVVDISLGAFPFVCDGGEPEVVMVPSPNSLELRRYL
ncbi:MAG: PAS domain-containing protein [Kordiimonadaceae bacterium]|nr:PAS domain-containing protein [Kordiimonadaceae bacterium]MBO6570583.1 PAS domain-containing protein [Kordiimonadaceae bacterium]MBO6966559.1 PAS domain-containing protein [Kordiimonadaceae bacterium]